MRKIVVAGNWKMNKTINEALELVKELKEKALFDLENIEMIVSPPFTALYSVKMELEGSKIKISAQNMYYEEKGAFTGEISPLMLKDIGVDYVIVGHSERRHIFGEKDELLSKKLKASHLSGITPIFCVGEKLEERESGKTFDVVSQQIIKGFSELSADEIKNTLIAYEPVWAIGTGKTATPEIAEEVHSFIRELLSEEYGKDTANYVIILYGGSVKPENAFSLMSEKDIDGVLVGGASLNAGSFLKIFDEGKRALKEKMKR